METFSKEGVSMKVKLTFSEEFAGRFEEQKSGENPLVQLV